VFVAVKHFKISAQKWSTLPYMQIMRLSKKISGKHSSLFQTSVDKKFVAKLFGLNEKKEVVLL
jgi:hypothetical protein